MTPVVLVAAQHHDLVRPNDTIRVSCVGLRSQGRAHIEHHAQMPNAEIAALCDIDESILNQRLGDVEKLGEKRPVAFTDYRKLLDCFRRGSSIGSPRTSLSGTTPAHTGSA